LRQDSAPRPKVRYRVTVAEIIGDTATVVMDATGAGFHAAVEKLEDGRLLAEHGIGGTTHLLAHLAELIADHPTSSHRRTPVTHYHLATCQA
jgi:hypothetical protein